MKVSGELSGNEYSQASVAFAPAALRAPVRKSTWVFSWLAISVRR